MSLRVKQPKERIKEKLTKPVDDKMDYTKGIAKLPLPKTKVKKK